MAILNANSSNSPITVIDKQVVGRVFSVPTTNRDIHVEIGNLMVINEKLKHDAEFLSAEVCRLRHCLEVFSKIALANIEQSKAKLEGV